MAAILKTITTSNIEELFLQPCGFVWADLIFEFHSVEDPAFQIIQKKAVSGRKSLLFTLQESLWL